MPEPCLSDAGPTPGAMTTPGPSRPTIAGAATCSPAATPARRTAEPESRWGRERRLSALSSSALLTRFARALFSERTPPDPAPMLPGLGGDSETSSKTVATRSSPFASGPVALGLTTSGTGCSCSLSKPTPSASLFGCKDVARMLARRERLKQQHGNGNGFGLTLGQWCAVEGITLAPEMVEAMLGFPLGWTDCGCSGTPSMSASPAGSARP